MIEEPTITDILINHFGTRRSLRETGQDYEALQKMIERERAANGESSRRLAALNVIAHFQLKLVLKRLVETPDKRGDSEVPTE
jgi:hypothetical protein